MTDFHIRPAQPDDMPAIIQLCREHAEFEQATYVDTGQADRLSGALFSQHPLLFCLVVDSSEGLVGYATYMRQYATWDAGHYMYMDCLFLRPSARNMGLGQQLMERITTEAWAQGCINVQWQTPNFNTRAIRFYERLGAIAKPKQRFFLYRE